MKHLFIVVLGSFIWISPVVAEEGKTAPSGMREDIDGKLEADEYRVISKDGSLTRRPCPYTCEMRGIPGEYCREFRGREENECYVKDTRYPETDVLG